MKRRLTISMGLINDPRLLFLDEPTSGLDVQSNIIIRACITDLSAKGVTVFLTTHNIEEANLTGQGGDNQQGTRRGHRFAQKLKGTMQSVQSVEVSLDHTSADLLEALKGMQQVSEVRKEGDKFRIITEDPPAVIASLMERAKDQNNPIVSLSTDGPS